MGRKKAKLSTESHDEETPYYPGAFDSNKAGIIWLFIGVMLLLAYIIVLVDFIIHSNYIGIICFTPLNLTAAVLFIIAGIKQRKKSKSKT
jgi:hypothetical protein